MNDQARHVDLEEAMADYTARLKEAGRLAHTSWSIKDYQAHETRNGVAFVCTLHVAGVKVADVQQDGNGGATSLYWTQAAREDGTKERFEAEAETLLPGDIEADATLVEALLTRQGL